VLHHLVSGDSRRVPLDVESLAPDSVGQVVVLAPPPKVQVGEAVHGLKTHRWPKRVVNGIKLGSTVFQGLTNLSLSLPPPPPPPARPPTSTLRPSGDNPQTTEGRRPTHHGKF
jgi:hypothetical protein